MRYLALLALLASCQLAGEKNRCSTQADCLAGYVCRAGTCELVQVCDPLTCDGRCGMVDDHCGQTLSCGACPDHCMNHAQDPTETDVDCGGDCQPCATGQRCAMTSDCQTGTCDVDTCRAGTWSTVAPMPTPREDLAAVAGADGRIYTIGGNGGGNASHLVEIYEPASNSWTTGAPMPTGRYGLAAVAGTDGKIYAIGGQYTSVQDAGPSVIAEVYDPVANAWQSLPALPVGRYHVAAAVDATNRIYAIGGFDGTTDTTLGSVATLQPGAASWSTLPDALTTPRSMHAGLTMPDGRIYVLGGEGALVGPELDAFEYYQPGATGWHTLPAMPTSRKSLAVASLGAQLFAIGGSRYVGSNMPYTRVVEVWDTSAQAWSQVTSLPSGRYGHAAVALGGKIYVLGGHLESTNARTGIVDVFMP